MIELDVAAAVRRLADRSIISTTESFAGSSCVLWTGHVDRQGYPNKVQVGGIVTSAHRLAFWTAHGPIPRGLQIDHRCHDPEQCTSSDRCPHRRCINPDHLEAVTPRENTLRSGGRAAMNARSTTCSRGHPWDKRHASGRRRCSTCEQRLAREEYARRTSVERESRTRRRRRFDEDPDRRLRKNRSARLAKAGLRPDECLNGHPYVDGSFRVGPSGRRECLTCRAARSAARPGDQ